MRIFANNNKHARILTHNNLQMFGDMCKQLQTVCWSVKICKYLLIRLLVPPFPLFYSFVPIYTSNMYYYALKQLCKYLQTRGAPIHFLYCMHEHWSGHLLKIAPPKTKCKNFKLCFLFISCVCFDSIGNTLNSTILALDLQ